MSLYYLILWNQVDILQKHFKEDHVHMRLSTRFCGSPRDLRGPSTLTVPNLVNPIDILHIYIHVHAYDNERVNPHRTCQA